MNPVADIELVYDCKFAVAIVQVSKLQQREGFAY